jgi:hypothetical protein
MRMIRRHKGRLPHQNHTGMPFAMSGIFACTIAAAVEDVFYSATDVAFWNTFRFHPVSIFAGTWLFSVCCMACSASTTGSAP